ncbi:enoyl-CoA hydratase/isomerase family protein [Alteribacillus bidgolensis]|uniref:Enoyl-CoA hydratase/carnithine racemase n=1 Tax=Alteribacillus bidgolensis TaxID=930129 RepID=A0A1G8G447_9BACI|nr:enoyl-CoA hydratase [Alteribacillus bidgolensis]SDH89097.1 Enoyl-CoA hydratase/carnithine racemase [Alteribacillus bidgolensis]
MAEVVKWKKEDGIAVVTIDNPPLNVLSKQVTSDLKEITENIREDDEVVCVILTGAGDKAFMAGADIKEFPELMGNPDMKNYVMNSHHMLQELEDLPKPTIALLNGMTFGGGCELALTCDMRIAEAHAQVGLPEVKLGLFPGGGGTQRLPRLVGTAKAKELMFSGEPINAEEAEKIGLVNKVVPTGRGMEMARQAASHMADQSLQALSRIKKAVNEGIEMNLSDGLEKEADLFVDVFQTEDVKEGVNAFIEKRKPNFKHR